MALFGSKDKKQEDVNLFYETEGEKTFYFKHAKAIVRIDDYFIRIARKSTLTNMLLQGLDGEKSILLSEITAYQLKDPGLTTGYLQLVFPGSHETKGGVTEAIKDENTIIFLKNEKPQILELKKAIENALINKVKK